MDQRKFCG